MNVLILAGGMGTRLRSVISDIPKVMAPMSDGKPFLEHLINYVRKYDPEKIILATGYKSEVIKDYFVDSVIYSNETEPLGTAGAIRMVKKNVFGSTSPLVVINGDTFFGIDLALFSKRHIEHGAWCSMGLVRVKDTQRYAKVITNYANKVLSLRRGEIGRGLITGGIFAFNPEALRYFPDKGSLEEDVIAKNLFRDIYGFPYNDYFIDIGIPEDYETCKNFLPQYLKSYSQLEK